MYIDKILFNDDLSNYWWNLYVYNDGIIFYIDDIESMTLLANTRNTDIYNSSTNYKSLKLFGNIYYNYVNILKNSLSDDEIIINNGKHSFTPTWDNNTYMLADFSNNIDASNVSSVNGVLRDYIIHRENVTKGDIFKVAIVYPDSKIIYDYTTSNEFVYRYLVTPTYIENGTDRTILGSPIITNTIRPNWESCSVIGTKSNFNSKYSNIYEVDKSNIWNFTLNVEDNTIEIVTDKNIYDGMAVNAKVNYGDKNYKKGSSTMLLGNIDCETYMYEDSISLANKWQSFCNNGRIKLLRDSNGNIIPIDITAKSFEYSKTIPSYIKVAFDWVQIESENKISVYEVGE